MRPSARAVFGLIPLLVCCAGSQPEGQDTTAKKTEKGALDPASCSNYARALCTELGPHSDGCRSVLGVVTLLSPRACAAGIDDFDTTRDRILELRSACDTVAKRVCAEMGDDSESCQAIRSDLPNIPPGHCAALLQDQDRLIAMLRERQAVNEPLDEAHWQSLLAGKPPSFGAEGARVVIVEFSDFQCPYCAEAASTVHKLKQNYSDRIRFVFRNFPLPFHPDAKGAAQASFAAHDQGKFWEFHDQLFAHQDALGSSALIDHAKAAGLDVEDFRTAAQASSTTDRVAEDVRLAESVHVQGTPTMFLNRERVENPLDYDAVAAAVDAALAPKQ